MINNTSFTHTQSVFNRWLIWVNIFIQMGFLFTLTFTPEVAAADEQKWLSSDSDITRPHPFQSSNEPDTRPFNQHDNKVLPIRQTFASESDDQINQVAGYASLAGSFMTSHSKGEAASDLTRSMGTGMVTGVLREWLSHFGTARIQLDMDRSPWQLYPQ